MTSRLQRALRPSPSHLATRSRQARARPARGVPSTSRPALELQEGPRVVHVRRASRRPSGFVRSAVLSAPTQVSALTASAPTTGAATRSGRTPAAPRRRGRRSGSQRCTATATPARAGIVGSRHSAHADGALAARARRQPSRRRPRRPEDALPAVSRRSGRSPLAPCPTGLACASGRPALDRIDALAARSASVS